MGCVVYFLYNVRCIRCVVYTTRCSNGCALTFRLLPFLRSIFSVPSILLSTVSTSSSHRRSSTFFHQTSHPATVYSTHGPVLLALSFLSRFLFALRNILRISILALSLFPVSVSLAPALAIHVEIYARPRLIWIWMRFNFVGIPRLWNATGFHVFPL